METPSVTATLFPQPTTSRARGAKVTGAGYLRVDRGRGVTADLRLIKLRAAVLASEAFVGPPASSKEKSLEKVDLSPVVEAAPFQKVEAARRGQ